MILKKRSAVFWATAGLWLALAPAAFPDEPVQPPPRCDPALAALFTPRKPLLGRYEVCTDPRPLSALASTGWTVEALESLEAFGSAGPVDRGALARLYGGVRAQVARGWSRSADRFETITLVSPYPDARLTRLERGTLIIRWICPSAPRDAEC